MLDSNSCRHGHLSTCYLHALHTSCRPFCPPALPSCWWHVIWCTCFRLHQVQYTVFLMLNIRTCSLCVCVWVLTNCTTFRGCYLPKTLSNLLITHATILLSTNLLELVLGFWMLTGSRILIAQYLWDLEHWLWAWPYQKPSGPDLTNALVDEKA